MADQTNKQSVVFSPSTYQRHNAAFDAVASQVVTRNPRKGISRFPGVAPGAWGLLPSGNSISAVSGTTLGVGSVKLCDDAGVVYDPEVQVDVLNAGGEIVADGGNKIVALEWTAGNWSVCGCGVDTVNCDVLFIVHGCQGAFDYLLPGAMINIWTDDSKTTLVASVTHGEEATLVDVNTEDTYYIEISHPKFYTQSYTTVLLCNDTFEVYMSETSDYVCGALCGVPWAKTLYLTDNSSGATATLVYDQFSPYAGGDWYGDSDSPVALAGTCLSFGPETVTYIWDLGTGIEIGYEWPFFGWGSGGITLMQPECYPVQYAPSDPDYTTPTAASVCSSGPVGGRWIVNLYGAEVGIDITITE